MRRFFLCASFLFLITLVGGLQTAFAASEDEIKGAVTSAKVATLSDLNTALSAPRCGGLMSTTDERVWAYYFRREKLMCNLQQWCTQYDRDSGNCIGKRCTIDLREGVPSSSVLEECDSSGSCVPVFPRRSCASARFVCDPFTFGCRSLPAILPYTQSSSRRYKCVPENGGGLVVADCYTYLPNQLYEFSYYPSGYNCVIHYPSGGSPIESNEPAGAPALIPMPDVRSFPRAGSLSWEAAFGSNVSVQSAETGRFDLDSSLDVLTLDEASISAPPALIHPTISLPTRLSDYPDLSQTIGRLLRYPEVRLILPQGGFGLGHVQSPLLSRIFSALRGAESTSPVRQTIGNTPDALRIAAEYLRSIPLLEVRYESVEILVPAVSDTELKERIEEWEAWLPRVQKMAERSSGGSLDPVVERIAEQNIEKLKSYAALQASIRNYRLHFPQYLDTLLRYVEQSNAFFQEHWVQTNVDRLEEWHQAFEGFLPELQLRLQGIYAAAAEYTAQCLVPACRLDAIPVSADTKPWDIFEGAVFSLSGKNRAWLPHEFPLWKDNFQSFGRTESRIDGRLAQWHPFLSFGEPIPDLTLDFSEIGHREPITIPLLQVEMHPMRLPFPPAVFTGSDIASLNSRIEELPRFTPPTFNLVFPEELQMPDPKNALFTVPEPPQVLPTWKEALTWRENQLRALLNSCDSSGRNFLVHEFEIYGNALDPAALRAVTFIPGVPNSGTFPPPTATWPGVRDPFSIGSGGGLRTASLISSLFCTQCAEKRPETTIAQKVELETSFVLLQDQLLRSIDEWNAQVKFWSVVPRSELTREPPEYRRSSSLLEAAFSSSP